MLQRGALLVRCSYCSASAPATWPASADGSSLARAGDEASDVDDDVACTVLAVPAQPLEEAAALGLDLGLGLD